MPVNVLVTLSFPDGLLDRIRAVSPDLQLDCIPLRRAEPLPSAMATAEILYTFSALPKPEEALKLRWVQFHSAGIDHVAGHPLLESDVLLTTTSGIHAVQVAEYVLSLMLAWAHHLPSMLVYQKRGVWPAGRWERFVPQELRGATVGILGYGSIGREIGRLAHAFGMRVLASKRDVRRVTDEGHLLGGLGDPTGELPDRIYPPSATLSMLAECDYVALALPLTAETRHVIDEDTLKAMKPTAFLVNIGRGGLVDEGALIKALQKGWIAGAGLDVFEVEPLPGDSPLWKLDNVIVSPHVAGFSPHYDERAIGLFVRNLRRYLERRPLLNQVDRRRGY